MKTIRNAQDFKPGTWYMLPETMHQPYKAIIHCPQCGEQILIREEQVGLKGDVERALCRFPGCDFIDDVILEGWNDNG